MDEWRACREADEKLRYPSVKAGDNGHKLGIPCPHRSIIPLVHPTISPWYPPISVYPSTMTKVESPKGFWCAHLTSPENQRPRPQLRPQELQDDREDAYGWRLAHGLNIGVTMENHSLQYDLTMLHYPEIGVANIVLKTTKKGHKYDRSNTFWLRGVFFFNGEGIGIGSIHFGQNPLGFWGIVPCEKHIDSKEKRKREWRRRTNPWHPQFSEVLLMPTDDQPPIMISGFTNNGWTYHFWP